MLIRLESVCPWPVSLEASVGKAVLFFFFEVYPCGEERTQGLGERWPN